MYLIFTEDDGWHTNQLVDAFNKNNKDVRLIKIDETSIAINDDPKILYENYTLLRKQYQRLKILLFHN